MPIPIITAINTISDSAIDAFLVISIYLFLSLFKSSSYLLTNIATGRNIVTTIRDIINSLTGSPHSHHLLDIYHHVLHAQTRCAHIHHTHRVDVVFLWISLNYVPFWYFKFFILPSLFI